MGLVLYHIGCNLDHKLKLYFVSAGSQRISYMSFYNVLLNSIGSFCKEISYKMLRNTYIFMYMCFISCRDNIFGCFTYYDKRYFSSFLVYCSYFLSFVMLLFNGYMGLVFIIISFLLFIASKMNLKANLQYIASLLLIFIELSYCYSYLVPLFMLLIAHVIYMRVIFAEEKSDIIGGSFQVLEDSNLKSKIGNLSETKIKNGTAHILFMMIVSLLFIFVWSLAFSANNKQVKLEQEVKNKIEVLNSQLSATKSRFLNIFPSSMGVNEIAQKTNSIIKTKSQFKEKINFYRENNLEILYLYSRFFQEVYPQDSAKYSLAKKFMSLTEPDNYKVELFRKTLQDIQQERTALSYVVDTPLLTFLSAEKPADKISRLEALVKSVTPTEYIEGLIDEINTLASLSEEKLPMLTETEQVGDGSKDSTSHLVGNSNYGYWNPSGVWMWFATYSMLNSLSHDRYSYSRWRDNRGWSYYQDNSNFENSRKKSSVERRFKSSYGSKSSSTMNSGKSTSRRFNSSFSKNNSTVNSANSQAKRFGSSFGSKSSGTTKSRGIFGKSSSFRTFSNSSRSSFGGK